MNNREECPEIMRDVAPYLRIDRLRGVLQSSAICGSERLFILGGGPMKKAALKKAILPKRQLRLYCMCVIVWK
uniref:Rod shape-determining protein MreB n=1 Tax=Angiostrongylus cantonensis TaxID=6313 RepID=A0A0K0DBJ7_ANGCA